MYEKITYSLIGSDKNTRSLLNIEKSYSIAWLVGGIILATIGTIIISKVRPNRYIVKVDGDEDLAGGCMDPPEIEKNTSERWKF